MWTVTGWAVAVWLKLTLFLAIAVGAAWWLLPTGSSWFPLILITAALVELRAVRALAAEWASEARSSWWWHR
ncbi:hypothetical protein [Pseudonocardia sp. D17]|uniref:hypothetical protein n=1 Tax=Pseudonocardia sp. D17 TaxID=882661 RepID=UPI002B372BF8|nr:hypothetical protein PSD17_27770 [Pseudonocardia sp. D17]